VVIGGLGTIEGPIIGVILFFLLRDLAADLGTWYLIGLGALAIAVMLIDRRGIWGALKARGLPTLFVTQRTLK
ncbi:MAG: branched-chain amino acid ABC transporter permease, partial [Rhodobacteraceae bacterium]|nr:branched-chain amino acid ABC transporter permease [Paracoccaceae bacterium]